MRGSRCTVPAVRRNPRQDDITQGPAPDVCPETAVAKREKTRKVKALLQAGAVCTGNPDLEFLSLVSLIPRWEESGYVEYDISKPDLLCFVKHNFQEGVSPIGVNFGSPS